MGRIETLREEALNSKFYNELFLYHFYEKFTKLDPDALYADAFSYAFSKLSPSISDGELIVGKLDYGLTDIEQKEWEENISKRIEYVSECIGAGQDSHMAIDYDLVLNYGLSGIIKKIDRYLENCEEDKKSFYNMCKKALEAVINHSRAYSEKAEQLAKKERDENRKAELLKIAEICKKVPEFPAGSFYEAVQSVHFITYCVSFNPFRRWAQQFQLGRPDRYLWRFYEQDKNSGKITKEEAQEILNCLGIMINRRVPNGLSSGYMVGGRDCNGKIVQNELTLMCMQVVDDIRLVYPAVGLCYTEGMDGKYLDKACEILSHGCSHPAIFNDDCIAKGLISYGVPERDSRDYIHSTCVEITPVAASNVWVASPYTNMAELLLSSLDREYESLDELIETLLLKLDESIKINFENENNSRKARFENSVNPLLSCFVNDCLENGVDIEKGSARYNWIMPSFVGMANLVDSLFSIKELVFKKKEYSIKQLKEILDADFEDNEVLRQRILNTIPKYGNDIDEVDEYFEKIVNHIIKECEKYTPVFQNGRLIPSVFCWIMHERFGRETGATPDGRCAGFPLGDGSGPCQGREKNGPTASILSSTKWEHHKLIGGVAVNMKFSKSSMGEASVRTMKSLVKTYMMRGGFEIQINVTDAETLKQAVKNPEGYQDLVVRIGGYSDYFTRLTPEMQQEVILRTEHII